MDKLLPSAQHILDYFLTVKSFSFQSESSDNIHLTFVISIQSNSSIFYSQFRNNNIKIGENNPSKHTRMDNVLSITLPLANNGHDKIEKRERRARMST